MDNEGKETAETARLTLRPTRRSVGLLRQVAAREHRTLCGQIEAMTEDRARALGIPVPPVEGGR